jgi:hypothetical protein
MFLNISRKDIDYPFKKEEVSRNAHPGRGRYGSHGRLEKRVQGRAMDKIILRIDHWYGEVPKMRGMIRSLFPAF